MFNERSIVYFRQVPTSAEETYQKWSFWVASKFVLIIMLSSLKDVLSKSKHFACNFSSTFRIKAFVTIKMNNSLEVYLQSQIEK